MKEDPDSVALLRRAQQGDMEAFAALFEPQRPMAFAIALRLAGADEAEDVVMNAFLKAWRALPGFDRRASLKTWLYRIVHNCALDAIRARSRHAPVALVDEAGEPMDAGELADVRARSPADEVVGREDVSRMDRALASLSSDMQTTLLLRFADGLSYADIAASTGVSIGTVMSRIFNGRRRLKALLGEDGT